MLYSSKQITDREADTGTQEVSWKVSFHRRQQSQGKQFFLHCFQKTRALQLKSVECPADLLTSSSGVLFRRSVNSCKIRWLCAFCGKRTRSSNQILLVLRPLSCLDYA